MAYPGLRLLMEKLKQMTYSNDIPEISNHPSMLSKRPQLQLQGLGSMIQTLLVEKENLHAKDRVIDELRKGSHLAKLLSYGLNTQRLSLNPEHLFNSIFESFERAPMELSPRTDGMKTQSVAAGGTSCSRNSSLSDEIVVGLDCDVDLIRGKLAEDTRKLDVVSIVGMGGSGKTTLATKVFNDPFVVYHFGVRGWVTVSQTYEKTNLLNQMLASIGVEIDTDKRNTYSHLREKLHKCLMRHRYLVVIDDIWNTEAWDDLKVVFPDHNNGSRLLLTSRNKKVALHAKPHGFVHQTRCLTDEESWELLHKKVFHGDDFPDSLTGPGMQIARNCHGLPLAVVVIAGVLAKEPVVKESWESISQSVSSLIFKGHMETLALSLNHLPSHLRNCFLYLGGFPEDYRFGVTRLIWLWIAEGFIQGSENQSLEETAKDYLMELCDRNLVVVQERKFDRTIKTFSVHDVLRELSSDIAKRERFSREATGWDNCIISPYKTSCLVMPPGPCIINHFHSPFEHHDKCSHFGSFNMNFSHSWRFIRVLDLKHCNLKYPEKISLLVNLRYLAIRVHYSNFLYTICEFRNLQTLIIVGISVNPLVLPNTISNLMNLRHLQCRLAIMFPTLQMPLMNLQTISNVVLGPKPTTWVNCFPGVKKLSCSDYGDGKYDLKSLTSLEILKICCVKSQRIPRFKKKSMISFPASLKKLTLKGCHLPWSLMSNIQYLPNLEVLNLLEDAFVGPQWDAGEEPFQQLKFLKFSCLDIQQWEASSINFPCLKQLVLYRCFSLEGIPLDIQYIPTLEVIQIEGCSNSVFQSANEIQEEQRAVGNYDLKIRVEVTPLTSLIQLRRAYKLFMQELDKVILNDTCGSESIVRTGISINLLTLHELQALGLPINHLPAHHHIRRGTIWNDDRSKNRPVKRKILKGARY